MSKPTPEQKLAAFMKLLKIDLLLSTRQIAEMSWWSEPIVRVILATWDMSTKHYDKIYTRLGRYIDTLQSEFIKCWEK